MNYEVELKFPFPAETSLAALEAAGPVAWGEPIEQIDRYFNHPARDFAQTDEALRLRSVGPRAWVTYKGPKLDRATKTRREIELPLAAPEGGIEPFTTLLESLGFRRVSEVHKQRRSGTLTWREGAVELALDEVAGAGRFVELEMLADDSTLDAAREALLALAAQLGLGSAERRSYLELVLAREGAPGGSG